MITTPRRGRIGSGTAGGIERRGPRGVAMISVLVADHHPLVREHLAEAISADRRLKLAGQTGDGKEALLIVERERPDAVVLDAQVPSLEAAAVLKRVREQELPVRVVLLSGQPDQVQVRKALGYHPDALLLRDTNAGRVCDELVAIEIDGVLSPGRLNLEHARLLARHRVELDGREWEVLKLSAQGLTRAQIGERLRFGQSTVRDIRRDICTKLSAPSIQVAIVIALRSGLLE
jgi:DNA-binding NarL/FixJ family response regulator